MSVPVFCCFSISGFPHIKNSPTIREKSDKKSAQRNLPESPKWGQRATTRDLGGHLALARAWPCQVGAWSPWPTFGCPFCLFIPRDEKPSGTEPFFANSPLFYRRRSSKIGNTRRTLPYTLPEGGTTSGSFSTTMGASRMNHE